jgi:hypothetical protein
MHADQQDIAPTRPDDPLVTAAAAGKTTRTRRSRKQRRRRPPSRRHNRGPPLDDDEFAGDLLVGADAIRDYLVYLGMPADVDIYYLKRAGYWPIGNTGGESGHAGKLIASKRRLIRHAEKITSGSSAA